MAFKFGASLMKRIPSRFFQMFRQKDWMKMAEQLAVNQNNLIMFYYRCIISDWRLNVLPWRVSSFIFFYPLNCQCQRVPNYSTVQISEEKKMPYGSIVYVSICYDLIVVSMRWMRLSGWHFICDSILNIWVRLNCKRSEFLAIALQWYRSLRFFRLHWSR